MVIPFWFCCFFNIHEGSIMTALIIIIAYFVVAGLFLLMAVLVGLNSKSQKIGLESHITIIACVLWFPLLLIAVIAMFVTGKNHRGKNEKAKNIL